MNSTATTKQRSGADCPAYCSTSIVSGFAHYEKEMAGRHACDPTGTKVHFLDHNFPKLIQLSFKGSKAHATRTLAALRSGNFDERDYAYDSHRFMTLFWIPDVIKNPGDTTQRPPDD